MLQFYLSLIENESDRNKLDNIYTSYYNLMISVAMKYTRNEEAAKDIVHDSILKIIKHLDDIDENNKFKTKSYLCAVVKHQAIDVIRKNHAVCSDDIDDIGYMLEDESTPPLEQILSNDGYERLVEYVYILNDTYKTVCQLKYINGLKESEIADILGLSQKAVNVRIYRGRQLLKRMITEGGEINE